MLKINRGQIVHLLTPLLTAAGGLVTAYVSKILPVHIDFTATFIAGASAALVTAIHWLHGWQLWERTVGKVVDIEDTGPAAHTRRRTPTKPVV